MASDAHGFENWLKNLTSQVQFSLRSGNRKRVDGKASDWAWFEHATLHRRKSLLRPIKYVLTELGWRKHSPMSLKWLHDHAKQLWATRLLLGDELSRLSFDFSLVLRATSHRHFYFPRIEFDDIASLKKTSPFDMEGLPRDYLGSPLQICEMTLNSHDVDLQVICNDQLLDIINYYQQYFVTRGVNVSPKAGEVVLDCGACIGEYSLLFAAMVGPSGQVHAFDPLPLHNRYCHLQARLNPTLASVMRFNAAAVGSRSSKAEQSAVEHSKITPGLRVESKSFDFVSLDDYVEGHLSRVDYIKMDIEVGEMDALAGAEKIIRTHKPRLAISGYHKPADLWEIPQKIMSFNPGYKLAFGHHSPVQWESVFYAIPQN